MKTYLFIIIGLFSATLSAQRNRDSNRIGISFGLNQFNLNTSNFDAKSEIGFQGGLSVRGNFYNDFDMVFGMQFSEFKFSTDTKELLTSKVQTVEYKLQGVQIVLLPSYKIVENHLSVEAGPVFQLNDKFKFNNNYEDNRLVSNPSLTAKDIVEVSKFNFNFAVGLTAGVRHFRLHLEHQFGINNMLSKLNDQDIINKPNFKGNAGISSVSLILYL
ncbi:outer membrane beta-barrel protein [Flavobacterium sp.]|uniref:outer membrane beta-barrel protein n=1 Tax=Flavobacterium sp. TaxID=239 RepID=UPI00286C58E0|nr:outer membrane beta-barrel protein [Flavobacterium sp.]